MHNDAYFLDDRGNKVGQGISATFESRGVGGTVGVADRPGDFEYHARLNNNTATTGKQNVRWGLDRDLNGLDRYGNNDSITINWSATGTGGSYSYGR